MGPYLCTTGGGREELTQHISVHAIIFVDDIFFCSAITDMSHGRAAAEVPLARGLRLGLLAAAAAVSPVGGFVCTMPCISPVGVFGGR